MGGAPQKVAAEPLASGRIAPIWEAMEIEATEIGDFWQTRRQLNWEALPITWRLPALAEHTKRVLQKVGFSASDVEVLRTHGVI